MGYLGSHLEDYYGYQLLDEVISQVKSNSEGDRDKLLDRLEKLHTAINKKDEKETWDSYPKYIQCIYCLSYKPKKEMVRHYTGDWMCKNTEKCNYGLHKSKSKVKNDCYY